MTSDPGITPIERMLDDMRRRVMAGDLASLPALEADLAQAVQGLRPATVEDAQKIRAKAMRNLACLEAAARGVRAARRRLDEIRQAASGTIVVYDDRGRRAETAPEPAPRQRL